MGQTCSFADRAESEELEVDDGELETDEEFADVVTSSAYCGCCSAPSRDAQKKAAPDKDLVSPLLKMRRSSSFAAGQDHPAYETQFPALIQKPSNLVIGGLVLSGLAVGLSVTVFEDWFLEHGVSRRLLLEYVSIPFVSVLFTYFHIWVALWLTFYPVIFVGCAQIPDTNVGCGWQGIIPNRAGQMAKMSVELMTQNLIKVPDIIERIDVAEVIRLLEPTLANNVIKVMDEALTEMEPRLWSNVPGPIYDQVIKRATRDAPLTVARIINNMRKDIERFFDVEEMVVEAFTQEPELLNHMFILCGFKELEFIRDCGGYMGLAAGILQVSLWIFYSAGWMLPTFGFIVGILSNWLALKMIFEPVQPRPCCFCTLQGLFLKRQAEVADIYAQIVADNVLSARNILKAIIRGPLTSELVEMIREEMSTSIHDFMGKSWHGVKLLRSEAHLERCNARLAESTLKHMPNACRLLEKYMGTAMALEDLLRDKMAELPPEDFEGLLHPVFQQDEWKLVLMGGVLGVIVGFLQWYALGA